MKKAAEAAKVVVRLNAEKIQEVVHRFSENSNRGKPQGVQRKQLN